MLQTLNLRNIVTTMIMVGMLITTVYVLATPAGAQEQSGSDSKPAIVEQCQELESRLSGLVDDFENRRQDHIERYSRISGLFTIITTELTAAGFDTAILEELQPGLEAKILSFSDTSETFIQELKDVEESACRDEDSFRLELDEARQSLKSVQQSVADVQNNVQQVLLPAIRNVVNFSGGQ